MIIIMIIIVMIIIIFGARGLAASAPSDTSFSKETYLVSKETYLV